MAITLYNSLTRTKEIFKPIQEGKIGLYVCGITVYDYCHIGHARVLVAFDVITRYLRSQGWAVDYVRNITDIDDKILNRAEENGEDYQVLTERFIDAMHEDEAQLNILPPDKEPRATVHMDGIIDMVGVLIDKGFAYAASNGDVYYRVNKFDGYGKLSGKNLEDLLVGARVQPDEAKEDARDFALWKAAKPGEVFWDSPWGKGRPGWHIECSAMSKSCLGATFDIHGGGPDLPFPHHENEIAQSEAANGCRFVNYWMHAGAVRVDGEKMSKSLGNFFTIREVLKKYDPEVIRFLIVSSHYRSPINYSEDNLVEAKTGLDRFYHALKNYADVDPSPVESLDGNPFYARFTEAMNDDFNTRIAISVMYDLVKQIHNASSALEAKQWVADLKAMGGILGILQADATGFLQGKQAEGELTAAEIELLIEERHQSKLDKNYARADEIRAMLLEKNIVLEDSREGTIWRKA